LKGKTKIEDDSTVETKGNARLAGQKAMKTRSTPAVPAALFKFEAI
jgi:hypothetical protein